MNPKILVAVGIVLVAGIIIYSVLTLFAGEKEYHSVLPEEFYRMMQNEDVFVIDVHIPEQKHIPGTDAWIPYNKIESSEDLLPKDKSTKILVYCRSGFMSKIAASKLTEMGYKNVYELDGGVIAWKQAGYEI
ncbi:rhodanese-like domain-containing protein [Geoglobus acetivorans]|uniref:Rhodanese-like domain-containing protein n=1 Tax=Geoglobus acetivorans TaxID=565033 RepID=A0ABZ3H6R5_GEOAI|nr:rhodanese-like domain-containing protein [Geoglobus acetivorans]